MRQQYNGWTPFEDGVIRDVFPFQGSKGVARILDRETLQTRRPVQRTIKAIGQRALQLGVKYVPRAERQEETPPWWTYSNS